MISHVMIFIDTCIPDPGECVTDGGELKGISCRHITRDSLGPAQHFENTS